MKSTKKKLKKSKVRKKAWDACSKYVRLRYANRSGYVLCYTCGKLFHWKNIQAGHAVAGRCDAILLVLDLIRPQCMQCNCFKSGRLDDFQFKLRQEYGDEKFENLYLLKHSGIIYPAEYFEKKRKWFEKRVKEMLCEQ